MHPMWADPSNKSNYFQYIEDGKDKSCSKLMLHQNRETLPVQNFCRDLAEIARDLGEIAEISRDSRDLGEITKISLR